MKSRKTNKLISTLIISSMIVTNSLHASEPTTTDANGRITSNNKTTFKGKTDEGITSYITGIATGALTTRLLISIRPMTTDVMVAGASGASYIAGEIVSTVAFKKETKDQEVEVTKTNTNEINAEQKDKIEKLKKNKESAIKALKVKSILQKAAGVGYGVAAGLAAYQIFQEKTAEAGCMSAGAEANTELSACASSSSVSGFEGVACGECIAKVSTEIGQIQGQAKARDAGTLISSVADLAKNDAARSTIMSQMSVPCKGGTAQVAYTKVQSACGEFFSVQKKNEATSAGGVPAMSSMKHIEKLLEREPSFIQYKIAKFNQSPFNYVMSYIFPETHAGITNLLSITGGAAVAVALSYTSYGAFVDAQISTPTRRAIIWTALAALIYKSSMDSDGLVDEIDKDVKKLGIVVADMNKLERGIKTQIMSENKIDIKDMLKNNGNAVAFSTSGNEKFPCLTNSGTSTCASIDDQFKNLSIASELDPSLMQLGSSVTKIGDSIQGSSGISGSTLAAANSIGANANAINRKSKNVLSELSRISKKKGFPETDINGEADKFSKAVTARMASAINKAGQGYAFGNSASPSSSTGLDPKGDLNDPKHSALTKTFSGVAPKGKDEKSKTMNFKLLDDKQESIGLAEEKPNLENLDIALEDISKDKSASIFEIISNRYLRSGYSKLLEEEKPSVGN